MLRNIILDLGGVLLDIDYTKTATAFKELGYTDFDRMYSQFTADELFADLEKGMVSNEAFYARLRDAGTETVSEDDITRAWNRMLLSWREKSLAFIPELSKKYKVFLLSNTNAIHLAAFNEILEKETGQQNGIDSLFDKVYYSHRVKLRKPNKDIFEFVAQDAGIRPEETLFIDDSINNIETAARLGFKTCLLQPRQTIEALDYSRF